LPKLIAPAAQGTGETKKSSKTKAYALSATNVTERTGSGTGANPAKNRWIKVHMGT
jgi:hypothetical protein